MTTLTVRALRGLKIVLAGLGLLMGTNALALDTASSLRGTVVDAQGNAVSNASVDVRNAGTSLQRSVITDANGIFTVRNLQVADDYEVSVTAPSGDSALRKGIALDLGKTTNITLQVQSAERMDEVVVVAARGLTQVALGPNATFDLATLRNAPAINRNISDILRRDARIFVD